MYAGFRNAANTAGAAGFASRRDFLRIGSLGALGLSLPQILAAEEVGRHAPRAKSILFYHHYGAPSHIDTFDPKPEAPAEVRGDFDTIATSAPEWRVSEIMPQIAIVCDRLTVIRSMTHRTANHNPGVYLAITGRTSLVDRVQVGASPTDWPNYGAVLAKLAPGDGTLPVAVQLPHVAFDQVYRTPGQTGGMLGSTYDPLIIERNPNDPDFRVDELSLRIKQSRLDDRRRLLDAVDAQVRHYEQASHYARKDSFYERAFAILTSPRAKRAFDLAEEPENVRDRYGRNKTGQSLLLSRRLIEAGVRFVTCFSGSNPGDGWDTHVDNFNRLKKNLMPAEDQAFSALIEDMDKRGLLDETLVVWSGEFGRNPHIAKPHPDVNLVGPGGRDHWPPCYCLVLAGAGVKRGFVYSQSDRIAEYPRTHPHSPGDLAATLFWALGLDPKTEVHDQLSRPFQIAAGEPIRGIFG